MASIQGGYGHGDVFAPGVFDFYGAGVLASGATVNMQTGNLVIDGTAISITVNLPLNPPDGAVAELCNRVGAAGTVTVTVAANTGDALLGTAFTSLAAATTARYKYSLNGDIVKGLNPRTWIRVL